MSTPLREHPRPYARLTQAELADRWRISPRSLEKWRTLGLGPAYIKVGGRVRYLLEDVLAYEAEHRRGGR
jgi:hypothetical protein